ncbi:MAG: hypothetical protein ABGX16_17830 [Pirellulales bacterium]
MHSSRSLLAMTNRSELRNRLTTMIALLRPKASTDSACQPPYLPPVQARITLHDRFGTPGPTHRVRIKKFDRHGITFSHRRPLHDRRVLVSIESPTIGQFVAEVDLSWCQFSCLDNYTSGGRFVQLANQSA